MANTLSASNNACQLRLEESMFGRIDQRMQNRRREHAGRFLKNLAVGETRDGGHDRVPPIRKRPRTIIKMSASEDDGRQEQGPVRGPELLHDRILDERAEQNLFGKGGRRKDGKKARQQEAG